MDVLSRSWRGCGPGGLLIAGLLAGLVLATAAGAQTLDGNLWITDGAVNSIAAADSVIYLGGLFSHVGPAMGPAVAIDAASGAVLPPYPQADGYVYAVAPDGSGGFYLGGSFAHVRGQPRANLAQIDSAGDVTAWNPGTNGPVNALAVIADTIYAAGAFNSIGGQAREFIAAVDGVSGTPMSWDPEADNHVLALAVSGGIVYAGGDFTYIGGQPRNYLAALDRSTGAATPWNPGADAGVLAVMLDGSNVIAGGAFSNIGGQVRSYVASLDGATGAATGWDPEAGGIVRALGRSALTIPPYTVTIYAGGDFGSMGGQSRGHLAAIDETGMTTSWNPGASGPVRAIAVARHGTIFNPYFTVFAGGDFTASGGQARDHLVEIDATGAATAWNPDADGSVSALALAGGKVYAGGTFPFLGGLARGNIAQLSVATGAATSWAPVLDGAVHALAVANGLVYVGGEFAHAGNLGHSYLASIDAATGTPTDWYAFPDGPVYAVMVLGNTVYVGGDFTHIGASVYPQRNHIAAVDGTTGDPTSWDPDANYSVHALAARILPAPPYTLTVYAGGFFTSIGGQNRNRIAEIDAAGLATSWDPDATDVDFPQFSVVSSLAVRQIAFPYSYTVFAGGDFTMIGGQSRNYIAALDGSGAATAFDPHANSTVETILVGDAVYAGGEFYAIGQPYQTRNGLAALDGATGQPLSWDAQGNGSVYALAGLGDRVLAGGSFSHMLGLPHDNLAALSTVTSAVEAPKPVLLPATALRVYPNPFSPRLTIELQGASAATRWSVRVYDPEGRLVRTLELHGERGVWDGNDGRGRPAPAGIYYCALAGRRGGASKVILVR